MCTLTVKDMEVLHLKCVINCFSNCPPNKEKLDKNQYCIDMNRIHYNKNKEVGCCKLHGKIPLGVEYR